MNKKTKEQQAEKKVCSRRDKFIHELAEYLAGTNQGLMSIKLQMGSADAMQWKRLRELTPLFGYPTIEEAEEQLKEFLR